MTPHQNDIKSRDLSSSKDSRPKKSKALKIFTIVSLVIISILVIIAIVLTVLLIKGKKAVLEDNKNADENIQVPASFRADTDTDNAVPQGRYVYYDGKKYQYNDKVTTVLFAGIDKRNYEHEEGVFGTAGQADCIFVMALNTETGDYKLMAVSRDTMCDVNTYDENGKYAGTEKMQICLSHGYGDGKEESCENLKRSVSRVFFGIPVNSYVAVDLDVISILNEQVGGVEVTVNEDLSGRDPALYEGANITLDGTQAEIFVRSRNIYGDENQNNLRMERQKTYLTSFIQKTLKMTKENMSVPLNMYNSISDYMVTDVDAAMVTYYTGVFLKSGFSSDKNLIKVPGKTVMGEQYAEYYTDTDEFFKIILDMYYTEVK